MTIVILVRHAETQANVEQLWHGKLDAPLTERGLLQVTATAIHLQELATRYPVTAFYVSPLPRAQSTAAAIGQAIGLPPIIDENLREFDLGDWEGRSFLELKEKEDLWTRWGVDPAFAPPNGESPLLFNRRATGAIQQLADRHPDAIVLAVTHGALLCNVLATWFGAGPADWRRWEPQNCAISILKFVNGQWQAELINDISHLPAAAIAPYERPIYAEAAG